MATATGAPGAEKNYLLLLAAAGVLLLIAIAGFFTYQSAVARDQARQASSRLVVDTLKSLARTGRDASVGVAPDFTLVQNLSASVESTLKAYESGDSDLGIPALSSDARPELEALAAAWVPMKAALRTLQDNAAAYVRVAANIKAITEVLPPVIDFYNSTLEKVARGASNNDVYGVSRQLSRLHRIQSLARQTLGNGGESEAAAQSLTVEVAEFLAGHRALTTAGTLDRAQAKATGDSFATAETASAAVMQDIQPVVALQVAATSLSASGEAAVTAADRLRQKIQGSAGVSTAILLISALAAGVAVILIGLYMYLSYSQARRRQQYVKVQEETQQQAILSLLDEITNLANGDLTGELTVTADFTGNIADSLNYTVQTLRGLVGTINDTSVEIAAAASSTTGRVEQMSKAAEGQAREIVRATQAISFASRSLEDVAGRAEKLAEQAKVSVDTAHNGAATVGRTIAGMATLREQIQDTAKRIKRLGESSQEIGNIIEFINDIAEQTNTLALNASIQAAMAGESGRGFAVVADQVRQLAERAGSATRQIENLVKTIQADTQEAITSMERSTANVVGGAKSAEEAGLSLTRIEASSQELAKVIQDIAGASRVQSAETTKLAGVMQGIRAVSVQTSTTAHQTAESVGELNTLSAKLRESVAGFKLPMDVSAI